MRIATMTFALAVALPSASLQAQYVGGGIVVHSGPVSAGVVFGPHVYYPPQRRVVVVHDYSPRVILVRRVSYRGYGYWRHRGYHPITVWYDDRRDCYYPTPSGRYPGLRPVDVYERDGSYFRVDQDRAEWAREDRGHHGHSDWEGGGR